MSKTYRSRRFRQNWGGDFEWLLRGTITEPDQVKLEDIYRIQLWCWGRNLSYHVWYNTTSPEGKKRLAYYRSDNGTEKHKEPGPKWFRNRTVERPQRRHAKNELRKFMLCDEYEVILNAKDHLKYWT